MVLLFPLTEAPRWLSPPLLWPCFSTVSVSKTDGAHDNVSQAAASRSMIEADLPWEEESPRPLCRLKRKKSHCSSTPLEAPESAV